MNEPVRVEWRDDIAIITISNPGKHNAMSSAMRDALTAALRELNDDPACRAIVLTGEGEHFSAGAELGGWNETEVRQCRTRLKRGAMALVREMIAGAKPIVAAIEGYAYGAGMALTCASDHVVASETARFCCAFTKVGFIPDMGLMYSLPNRVGPAKAKQLIALADVIDVQRAERLGLVDDIAPAGQALEMALALARRYADGPPLAFDIMKSVFARGLEAMLQAELDLQPILWLSEDHVEGKAATRERRKPLFRGK
jgi:2-(1,2-epoxy-1,2-dihydrophenyl)acetyl-CoA isomerase